MLTKLIKYVLPVFAVLLINAAVYAQFVEPIRVEPVRLDPIIPMDPFPVEPVRMDTFRVEPVRTASDGSGGGISKPPDNGGDTHDQQPEGASPGEPSYYNPSAGEIERALERLDAIVLPSILHLTAAK